MSLCSAILVKAAYFHWKKLAMQSVRSEQETSLSEKKSYSLKIGIDSVNQILRNKEKVR